MTPRLQRRPGRSTEVRAVDFYVDMLTRLLRADVEFLIGGGFAYAQYAGRVRPKKDLDIHVRPRDLCRVLDLARAAGYGVELPFSHWLGKIRHGDALIDVIFSSGNGIARVDDLWFEHAVPQRIFDLPLRMCPIEELIWSKAFVQERERFDGSDVLHLLLAYDLALDWDRLLLRFGEHWRILLSHLVLFGFVYPSKKDRIPHWVVETLLERFENEPYTDAPICRGALLSRAQYLFDLTELGYTDPRLVPEGTMTREQVERWTAAIDEPEDAL